jgi:hypothetical protein
MSQPFVQLPTGLELRAAQIEQRERARRAECAWVGFALGVSLTTILFGIITLITR